MAAFEHAVGLNTDMLELDVYLTKDKQVVVFHDENLQRLCGSEKSIKDFEYDNLPKV